MRMSLSACLVGLLVVAWWGFGGPGLGSAAAQEPGVHEALIAPGKPVGGVLEAGDHMMSTDGTYFDAYILPVRAGRTYSISLASEDFDAYLMIADYVTGEAEDDDDSGQGLNSMLARTAEGDGFYVVQVNSIEKATGAYTLHVQELSPALSPAP